MLSKESNRVDVKGTVTYTVAVDSPHDVVVDVGLWVADSVDTDVVRVVRALSFVSHVIDHRRLDVGFEKRRRLEPSSWRICPFEILVLQSEIFSQD